MIRGEISAWENRHIILKKSLKPKTGYLRIHQSDWSKKERRGNRLPVSGMKGGWCYKIYRY